MVYSRVRCADLESTNLMWDVRLCIYLPEHSVIRTGGRRLSLSHNTVLFSYSSYTFEALLPIPRCLAEQFSSTFIHDVNANSFRYDTHNTVTVYSKPHIQQSLLLAAGNREYIREAAAGECQPMTNDVNS